MAIPKLASVKVPESDCGFIVLLWHSITKQNFYNEIKIIPNVKLKERKNIKYLSGFKIKDNKIKGFNISKKN